MMLSNALDDNGQTEEAILNYRMAKERMPTTDVDGNKKNLDENLAIALDKCGLAVGREVVAQTNHGSLAPVKYFIEAIELSPTLASPYYNLGKTYEMVGLVDVAIYVYRQGLERVPITAADANGPGQRVLQDHLNEAMSDAEQYRNPARFTEAATTIQRLRSLL
jgi:tetratricopeptide (TPR) repeat protein